MTEPRLAVVTVVSGRHDHLRAQRRGLVGSTVPPVVHVVVAMGDPAIDAIVAESALPTDVLHVAVPPGGLPLAAARNAGAAQAAGRADVIVFLDVDCIPDPELLSRYAAAATRRPDALLCGPVTYLPPSPSADWSVKALRTLRAPHDARPDPPVGDLLEGDDLALFWSLSFAVTTATWHRIGGFYEGYVGYGGEDTDFARTADAAGAPIVWVGGADAYHQHHGIGDPASEHVDDILGNGAVFARRHGEWPMGGWLAALQARGTIARTATGWQRTDAIRVLSMPQHHDVVRAVLPPAVVAAWPHRQQGWHPDPMWDLDTFRSHADAVDVVHLHFGFDAIDVDELQRWTMLLAELNIPLILTVHDLRNPHHATPDLHDRQLAVLVAAAAHVLTLTDAAAAECACRFGRTPEVVPHPGPRVDDPLSTERTEPGLVIVPLKALRANVVEPLAVVRAAVAGATEAGGRVRVLLHPSANRPLEVAAVGALAASGAIELDSRPFLGQADVDDLVARAHAWVLPYRFGTHSGWAELCRDLGTRLVAPDCGYIAEQGEDVLTFVSNERDGFDPSSLSAAVARALGEPAPPRTDPVRRAAERDVVRATHAARYREVLGR